MLSITRRSLLAGMGAAVLTGCSRGRKDVLDPGWERTRLGAVTFPVPRQWSHTGAQGRLWTDLWSAPDGGALLLAGRPTWSADPTQMVAQARGVLRDAATGFSATTTSTTVVDGGQRLSEDMTTTTPQAQAGRLWVLTNGEEAVALALLGPLLDTGQVETIEEHLRIDPPSGAPALREGWKRVRLASLATAVPVGWVEAGAVSLRSKWSGSWADADLDGSARARLLLAPRLKETSIVDALARIEADSQAGALPGYERKHIQDGLVLGELRASRVSFRYDDARAHGSIWVVSNGELVSALQLSFSGAADPDVVTGVEESIWIGS